MIIDDKLTLNLDDTIALMVNLELPIIPVLLNHPDSNLNKKPLNNNQVAGACYHQGYLTVTFEEAARRADGYFKRDKLLHQVQGKVNVGIGLALEPPHLICIDFDNHPDKFIPYTTIPKDGLRSLQQMQELHGPLPPTWTWATPSGGCHFIYTIERCFGRLTSKYKPGVDLLTDGYSILPTLNSGYRVLDRGVTWFNSRRPSPCPQYIYDWLVERAKPKVPRVKKDKTTHLASDGSDSDVSEFDFDDPEDGEVLPWHLERIRPKEFIMRGERHATFVTKAVQCRQLLFSRDYAEQILQVLFNEDTDQPADDLYPWSDVEEILDWTFSDDQLEIRDETLRQEAAGKEECARLAQLKFLEKYSRQGEAVPLMYEEIQDVSGMSEEVKNEAITSNPMSQEEWIKRLEANAASPEELQAADAKLDEAKKNNEPVKG